MKKIFVIVFALLIAAALIFGVTKLASRPQNMAEPTTMESESSERESDVVTTEIAPDIESQTQPETTVKEQETNPETEPQTQPETNPETNPETEPQTQPETNPETEPQTQPQTQPETTVKDPETNPETEPQTQPETFPETIPETTPMNPVVKNRDELVQYATGIGYRWYYYLKENTTVSINGMPPAPVEKTALVNGSGTYSAIVRYYAADGFEVEIYSGKIMDESAMDYRDGYSSHMVDYENCITGERAIELINKYK